MDTDTGIPGRIELQRWCPGLHVVAPFSARGYTWIQARQGRLVLATCFVEHCGCPVGLLRAAKKLKRLYFIYCTFVKLKKKVFVGKMSPGCTSGPFPSRLSPFSFFPDHPRSLGVPNFHKGAPLKNPFLPPPPLQQRVLSTRAACLRSTKKVFCDQPPGRKSQMPLLCLHI